MNFDEILIEEVQKNKILYDKSAGGYKNVKLKTDAWKSISEATGKSGE